MAQLDRRGFLELLGLGGLGLLLPMGCSLPPDACGLDGTDGNSLLCHGPATLAALMDTFVPREEDGTPGAVECGALSALRIERYARAVIDMGFVGPLPPELASELDAVDVLIASTLVADLDVQTAIKHGVGASFRGLSRFARELLVTRRMADPVLGRVYELARAAAMIAFAGATPDDVGFPVMGLPRYQDLADYLHNSGYPDYAPNVVPSFEGRQVFDETVDGDLP